MKFDGIFFVFRRISTKHDRFHTGLIFILSASRSLRIRFSTPREDIFNCIAISMAVIRGFCFIMSNIKSFVSELLSEPAESLSELMFKDGSVQGFVVDSMAAICSLEFIIMNKS